MKRFDRHRRALLALVTALAAGFAACSDAGTGPEADGPTDTPNAYDHARAPGASANDLLSGASYDRLIVQVQYVSGFPPSSQGLQHLEDFLNARLNKPAGIEIRTSPISITAQPTYSAAEIRALEQQHRTLYSQGRTLVTYFLWIDGEYADGANVLGIAYNNTSMAIFAEKIDDNTGAPLQPSKATVEGTVAMHEFGHILGLVNNGSAMQVEHQDEPNGRHCDDPDCLMYYAVRTTDFLQNLMGGIPSLDPDCIEDLQANGGK